MPPLARLIPRLAACVLVMAPTTALAVSGQWMRLPDSGAGARTAHALLLDPLRQRALVFGGVGIWLPPYDLWALPRERPWNWAPLYVPGTLPAGRLRPAMAREVVSDRFVMFGGRVDYTYYGDLWVLSSQGNLATWKRMRPPGGPGPRETVAVSDSARGRVLVYGGLDLSTWFDDLWEVRLVGDSAQWAQVPTSTPRPDGRVGCTLVMDTRRDRLVLYGGHHGTFRSDVWALPLAGPTFQWQTLYPVPLPGAGERFGHVAAYVPSLDAMLVFGGRVDDHRRNDAWLLRFAPDPVWEPLSVAGPLPEPREFAAAAWDAAAGRLIVYGGMGDEGPLADAWALTLGDPPLDATPTSTRLAFAGASPHPVRGDVRLSFTLPAPGAARLRLYDVAGRRRGESVGTFGAGTHRVRVDTEAPLAPGLYVAELAVAGERLTTRVVVSR